MYTYIGAEYRSFNPCSFMRHTVLSIHVNVSGIPSFQSMWLRQVRPRWRETPSLAQCFIFKEAIKPPPALPQLPTFAISPKSEESLCFKLH